GDRRVQGLSGARGRGDQEVRRLLRPAPEGGRGQGGGDPRLLMPEAITHLFTDLGGVLLTNGWDRNLRRLTAEHFGVDPAQMDERHHLTYDTYESGKTG